VYNGVGEAPSGRPILSDGEGKGFGGGEGEVTGARGHVEAATATTTGGRHVDRAESAGVEEENVIGKKRYEVPSLIVDTMLLARP
jgi:hypothetical protein